ncbi:MAG: phosphate acyltransferase PlsX, partial [Fusobacteriota bacterium]
MKIALDAMGGDYGPKITVKGAVQALEEIKDLEIKLIGDSLNIKKELTKYNYDEKRLEIIHTDKKLEINEGDSISRKVRNNPKASMNIALKMVKEGKADGSVSAGNTGALMTSS